MARGGISRKRRVWIRTTGDACCFISLRISTFSTHTDGKSHIRSCKHVSRDFQCARWWASGLHAQCLCRYWDYIRLHWLKCKLLNIRQMWVKITHKISTKDCAGDYKVLCTWLHKITRQNNRYVRVHNKFNKNNNNFHVEGSTDCWLHLGLQWTCSRLHKITWCNLPINLKKQGRAKRKLLADITLSPAKSIKPIFKVTSWGTLRKPS